MLPHLLAGGLRAHLQPIATTTQGLVMCLMVVNFIPVFILPGFYKTLVYSTLPPLLMFFIQFISNWLTSLERQQQGDILTDKCIRAMNSYRCDTRQTLALVSGNYTQPMEPQNSALQT